MLRVNLMGRILAPVMCLCALAGAAEDPASPAATVKGFTAHGGQWAVREGVLHAEGGAGPKLVAEGAEFGDGAAGVEVFFKDAAAGNAGLIVRVSQAGEGADAFVGYEIALDAERGVVRLGRHKNNFTNLRDAKADVPVGKWVALVVRLTGKRIEIDVGGKEVLDMEDPDPLPAGSVGLRPWQRAAMFRNLWYCPAGGGAASCRSCPARRPRRRPSQCRRPTRRCRRRCWRACRPSRLSPTTRSAPPTPWRAISGRAAPATAGAPFAFSTPPGQRSRGGGAGAHGVPR